MLAVGAALLGAAHVLAVDVDDDALDIALANRDQFEDALPVDFVRADVAEIAAAAADGGTSTSTSTSRCSGSNSWRRACVETVIMNPPFGTRRKGADVTFLRAAAALVRARGGAVYSLHKSSTRAHLQKLAARELGCSEAHVLAELRYDLPATYKFHKDKSRDIEVDLWRFVVPGAAAAADGGGGSSSKRTGRGRQQQREGEELGSSGEEESSDDSE
jgi:predicted RNA methylase